jgi:hypothetical protein
MCRRRINAVARTLVRVFAVFAVLTGVLLVHGFSGDHDLNGGLAGPGFVQVSAEESGGLAPVLTAHDHADGRHAHLNRHATAEHAAEAGTGPGAAGDHGGHGDAHTCLALLTASALVLVGVIVRLRAARTAQAAAGARAYLRSRAQALARPAVADLSMLCVSRT